MGVAAHPLMTTPLRVAAVGDLHCTRTCEGAFQSLFAKIGESADVLVLCGDLTDYGTPEEARVLAKELGATKLPKVAVLGNHDFESGAADEVSRILADAAGVTRYTQPTGACNPTGGAQCSVNGVKPADGPMHGSASQPHPASLQPAD